MNEFRTRSELIGHSAPVRLGNLAYQAGLGVQWRHNPMEKLSTLSGYIETRARCLLQR